MYLPVYAQLLHGSRPGFAFGVLAILATVARAAAAPDGGTPAPRWRTAAPMPPDDRREPPATAAPEDRLWNDRSTSRRVA